MLNYLEQPFDVSMKSNRTLFIQAIKEKLCKSYGILAKIKGQFDKNCLGRLYNSTFGPHKLSIMLVWQLFNKTRYHITHRQFFRYCKFCLGFPLWFRNTYITKKYSFDITVKMEELSLRFQRVENVLVIFL